MKIYRVGGSIRDELLGLPVSDHDYLVVGATPEQMIAAGYRPVGRDFPVFLHPTTQAEYALARTERKVAPGYSGFLFHAAPHVTVEEDLRRRDLTINAMARDSEGRLVDPYGGRLDLRDRVLRHVSEAFQEDPVRILRVARFAARFTQFRVAPETTELMRAMVDAREVDALVPERVWQELCRGLMEAEPSRMFDVLRETGALAHIAPELDAMWDRPVIDAQGAGSYAGPIAMRRIDRGAREGRPLTVRFALLAGDLVPGQAVPSITALNSLCERLRVPVAPRDLARLLSTESAALQAIDRADAASLVSLLERCDAYRKPERFGELLLAWRDRQDERHATQAAFQAQRAQRALRLASEVDAGAIAAGIDARSPGGAQRIRDAIQQARTRIVADRLAAEPAAPDGEP